jgi:hypothetical protein
MKNVILIFCFLASFLFLQENLNGQLSADDKIKQNQIEQMKYERAKQELENILDDAYKITDPLASVKVKAKAASLLWTQSPERGRKYFLSLWGNIENEKEKTFAKEDAKNILLKYLFPKDQPLANELLKKLLSNNKAEPISSFERVAGNFPEAKQLADLSVLLVEIDATLAAKVLEKGLAYGTAPSAYFAFVRLREKDPLLANYVASRALEIFQNQSPTTALTGLGYVSSYIFPLNPLPATSPEIETSDENLRIQFVSVGYLIIKRTLAETNEFLIKEQRFDQKSLGLRTTQQAILAATLAALAPRYAPHLIPELNELSNRLLGVLPTQVANAAKAQANVAGGTNVDEDDPSLEIVSAIARGEFDKADRLIFKVEDENKKKIYLQLLWRAQLKAAIRAAELNEALKIARKFEMDIEKMSSLAEVAKAARKNGDTGLSSQILSEARSISPNPDFKGVHARGLLSLAAEMAYFSLSDASLTLQIAVKEINSLNYTVEDPKRKLPGNDILSFLDSNELLRAFNVLGKENLEDTLLIAARIDNKAVQLIARLATIEPILKKPPAKPKTSTPVLNKQ